MHFILLNMTINSPLKWEIGTAEATLLWPKFFSVWTHFDDSLKILTYRQILPNIFYLRLSYENKSQAHYNWFVFKGTSGLKKRG